MLQPPWDAELAIDGKPACIFHFTYGNDFDEAGKLTAGKIGYWHWDKRDYMVSLWGGGEAQHAVHAARGSKKREAAQNTSSSRKGAFRTYVRADFVRRKSTLPSTSPCRQRGAPITR
jgi:hypothetical protein